MRLQVYSTELVTTLGSASKRLLDGLAAHMVRPKPHDSGHAPDPLLAPRVIFALLQSPLNGADRELLAGLILNSTLLADPSCIFRSRASQSQAVLSA